MGWGEPSGPDPALVDAANSAVDLAAEVARLRAALRAVIDAGDGVMAWPYGVTNRTEWIVAAGGGMALLSDDPDDRAAGTVWADELIEGAS